MSNPINKTHLSKEVPEIQYKITWDFIDTDGKVHQNMSETFADKDIANEAWKSFKNSTNITNVRTETIHNTTNTKKYFAVEVIYFNYPKVYTFLAKQKVTSEYAVVGTNGILQVVKVVRSYETTREQLEKRMHFSCYSYISGVVKGEE